LPKNGFSYPHDRLLACLKFPRDLGNARAGIQSLNDCGTFLRIERWGPAKLFTSRLRFIVKAALDSCS
jgi:hypothetical protein